MLTQQNYTQNIDTLESVAGVHRVVHCHGSFSTATCLQCQRRVPGSEIESEILSQRVPLCLVCNLPNPCGVEKGESCKKASKGWDSDEDDESDESDVLPGIMKVINFTAGISKCIDFPILDSC